LHYGIVFGFHNGKVGVVMCEAYECRQYAKECAVWAEATSDADLRQKLLKMATDWLEAAESLEREQPSAMHALAVPDERPAGKLLD
jgi:hypothetical protein